MIKKALLIGCLLALASVPASSRPGPAAWRQADPLAVAKAVADRELFGRVIEDDAEVPAFTVHHDLLWLDGTLMAGVAALYDRTEEVGHPVERYRAYLEAWADRRPGRYLAPLVHGDQVCAGQAYIWLYERSGKTSLHLQRTNGMMDFLILGRKATQYQVPGGYHHYWMRFWQDDVHMIAPFLAFRGRAAGTQDVLNGQDPRRIAMDYCRAYHDVLGDPATGLYWHNPRAKGDYYWGRGNGWVAAGFFKVMKVLEEDPAYAADADWLAERLTEMAATLKATRNEHGTWGCSITDPENFPAPETSGSAFFTYMIAGMLNDGRLGDDYRPVAEKAWGFLYDSVSPDGDVTRVQPTGRGPIADDFELNSESYGVGGVILAGIELSKLKPPSGRRAR